MRRRTAGAFAGAFVLLFTAGAAWSATQWRVTVAPLPADAPAGNVSINAISCPSPGNCTAVGSYGGTADGLLLDEKAGHWKSVAAVLPADASSDQTVSLDSVSCASAGNCTAIGTYVPQTGTDGWAGLLLTETGGHWGTGVEASLPANPGSDPVVPNAVSCVSAGNCTAVLGRFLLTETAGHWAKGVLAPLPADANPAKPVEISSVSCSADGHCSAVGTYNLDFGRDVGAGEGLMLTKKSGTWHAVKAVMPPDGPGEGVVLSSVSCAQGGNCSAIGTYNINIDWGGCCSDEAVLLTEKAGKWQRGVKALPPQTAKPAHALALDGISCPSRKSCVALGDYFTSTGAHLTMLTEAGGMWRRGVKIAVPSHVTSPYGWGISCASAGNCTAVANYYDNHGDGHEHALVVTETAGHWAEAVKVPLPADSFLNTVSCAAPGRCGAVGGVGYPTFYGVLLDSSAK